MPMPTPTSNPKVRVQLVHEDDRVIVMNKMPGVVTEPGRSHGGDSLLNGLLAHDGGRFASRLLRLGEDRDWGLLHRLDRWTSGLLVAALDADAWDALRAAFEARSVRKTYLAIARGELRNDAGSVEAPLLDCRIGEGVGEYRVSVIDRRGKPALTRYRVLARAGRYALVECDLVTGRLHQIRVHLASLGAPVAGDPIYEPGGRAKPNAGRGKDPALHLHAWKLAFPHPESVAASTSAATELACVGGVPRKFTEFAESHGLPLPPDAVSG
jgi:23S rRNA pseudouridine1911/1915/1917 synthase